MNSNKHTKFHTKHEILSQEIYHNGNMLPSRYVFVLTNKCNLNCSFCYQDKKSYEDNMQTNDWINLIEQLPEYSRVTLTGGEPFMYSNFKNIFSIIAKKFSCNIISNGLLLSKDTIDFILSFSNFEVLSISIDDIGNLSRDVSNKQWLQLKENLTYFVKRRDELNLQTLLDIKTLILDENSEQLFDIYKYCREELNCDTHAFQFLKGSSMQHADVMFSYEKIFETPNTYIYKHMDKIKAELSKVQKYNQSEHKISYVHPHFVNLNIDDNINKLDILNLDFEEKHYKKCIFPWSSVHINYDGELIPCLAVSMGNVKHDSLKNIVFGNKFMKFKSEIKNNLVPACSRCGWLKDIND